MLYLEDYLESKRQILRKIEIFLNFLPSTLSAIRTSNMVHFDFSTTSKQILPANIKNKLFFSDRASATRTERSFHRDERARFIGSE